MEFNRREWLAGSVALAGLAAVPSYAQAEALGGLPEHMIHPELRDITRRFQKMTANRPGFNRANLPQLRAPNPFSNQPPLDSVPLEKRLIPGGKSQPDVVVFVINARAGTSRPAILHTHGGGYVTGSAESSVRQLQQLCARLDCVAVSVEYRLAPETTYAGSIEDNYAGLKWLHANATELGVDPARIALLGESAGGGHAAMLALVARDRGEVPVCFQCLIYPMLDDRTGTTRKMPPWAGKLAWTPEDNHFGWESFLGAKPGRASAPKYAVPARMPDLKGLPPAFIGVGTLDLFCDENIEYARRLTASGVGTELIVVPGAFHGFDGLALIAKARLGTWFEQTKLNALRRAFGMAAE
ncbi:alpha/beta hydrolase [Novosphingobium sp. TH158]|uniref:alpha/beta hydrolase n=1 Tax=Novosphingobium sp. TH158 TaxID=2067455 RepID=UPI000C7C3706|nr:alpha/beta hydrolase [Novosphingobium sp. TH158]PLK26436.1 alpha/beta hydrolase [Novosphingobium sp. TH158]